MTDESQIANRVDVLLVDCLGIRTKGVLPFPIESARHDMLDLQVLIRLVRSALCQLLLDHREEELAIAEVVEVHVEDCAPDLNVVRKAEAVLLIRKNLEHDNPLVLRILKLVELLAKQREALILCSRRPDEPSPEAVDAECIDDLDDVVIIELSFPPCLHQFHEEGICRRYAETVQVVKQPVYAIIAGFSSRKNHRIGICVLGKAFKEVATTKVLEDVLEQAIQFLEVGFRCFAE